MQKSTVNAIPGPANDSYDALKDQTGPLQISAAVISTKYLCQVPKRKSTGTILVSILVADLVFMQALWKIFTFCSQAWLDHKDPQGTGPPPRSDDIRNELTSVSVANDCAGCERQTSMKLQTLQAKPERESSEPEELLRASPGPPIRAREGFIHD